MARAARRDVSSVCDGAWRVTAKTRDMSIEPRWNREPNAGTISSMASDTGRTRMLRVLEPRIKTAQRWKRFDLSALHIRVTNRANLARRICELWRVATGARRMCSLAG